MKDKKEGRNNYTEKSFRLQIWNHKGKWGGSGIGQGDSLTMMQIWHNLYKTNGEF